MSRWEAWVIRAGFGLAAVSGIALGVMKYFLSNPDPDSRVGHPMQPAVLAAHVLAAPVAVFAIGLLWRGHALARIRRREKEGRATGLLLFGIGLPMVFSGYLVQVFTSETARKASGWFHAVVGVVFALAFALHLPASRPPDDSPEAPPEPQRRLP
jgi:uncharacterized membrane protein YidH (DUF202 family)